MKVLGYIGMIIAVFAVAFGVDALIAWFVMWAVGFVFGYDIGFWQTFVAILLIGIIGNILFGRKGAE
ncbi:hypothetical protein [Niallia circulans]|uniref:hypothetical protein n=1 Tax=Niallia circulans TaxID=1397 RepID=UPI00155FA857|nr:hypothetical protein [Niallia circulans]NRG30745.1 hypothetical protein [Niallia circulans]